jgi:hypothetical protein
MADAAEPVVEGVSNETHQALKTEADKLREQLAVLRAKQEVVDSQKREELLGLKSDVSDFVSDIAGDAEFKPYTAQLQPCVSTYLFRLHTNLTAPLLTVLLVGCFTECVVGRPRSKRESRLIRTSHSAV